MTETRSHATVASKWLHRALIGAVLLACGVALSPNMVDTDIWGHVRFGQDLLEGKGLPATTEYSFTAEDYPWINHELASELMLAGLAWLGGGAALMIAKCLLGLLVVGLILRTGLRRGASFTTMAALALLVSVNLTYHWATRPQVFSYTYFAILLVLLDRAFADWSDGGKCRIAWLWCIPPLIVLWTNTHGAFVAGVCIAGAYLLGRMVETLLRMRRNAKSWIRPKISTSETGTGSFARLSLNWKHMLAAKKEDRHHGRSILGDCKPTRADGASPHFSQTSVRILLSLSLVGVVTLLATLANPYGYHLPLWLVESLGQPRPEISEWAAMSMSSVTFWPYVILVGVVAIALVGTRERRDWTQIVVLTVCAWQAMRHGRHVPFFAIAAGFWIGPHLESCLARLRKTETSAEFALPRARWARTTFILALLGVYMLLGSRLYDRINSYRVDKARWPVAAFQYMSDHELGGRLVVAFDWAQYAIAAFHEDRDGVPQATVAMDGRFRTCYSQELIDMHFDFFGGHWPAAYRYRAPQSGPINPTRTLEHKQPNLVLVGRENTFAVNVLSEHPRWVLLYQDSLAQVWGSAAIYDDATSIAYLPPSTRQITDDVQQGTVAWPALPLARRKRLKLLTAAATQSRIIHTRD